MTALVTLQTQLTALCASVRAFPGREQLFRPPIIDAQEEYGETDLPGLRRFRTVVETEARWIGQLAASPNPPAAPPSSNAPFLCAVWKEVLAARRPLVALSRPVNNAVNVKDGLKIDVVAEGGRRWIKVNTIKASRLLIEFREQDSYVNSDYDSDDSASSSAEANPNKQLAAFPFTPVNTITKQCHELATAAQAQRLRTGMVPAITYRLTRMSGDETGDERIQATYACVRGMGIQLEFGESAQVIDPCAPVTTWRADRLLPSLQLNLDLSLLIALVSDITHAVLPATEADADERFKPVPRAWKRQANGAKEGPSGEGMEPGVEEHFRALAGQVKEEMRSSLIDDLEARLSDAVAHHQGDTAPPVELWTTSEARERCRDIVQKIGGPTERQRCRDLFARDPSGFWKGSRHENRRGVLRDLGVRVYEDEWAAASTGTSVLPADNAFRSALEDTAQLLQQMGMDKVHSVEISSLPYAVETTVRFRTARKGASAPEKIHIPTAHTSRSLLAGIQRGLTTVTANRMSIKQVVRALGRLEGLDGGVEEKAVIWVVEPKTLSEQKRCDLEGQANGNGAHSASGGIATAAVWVVEPRSLAEEMRT